MDYYEPTIWIITAFIMIRPAIIENESVYYTCTEYAYIHSLGKAGINHLTWYDADIIYTHSAHKSNQTIKSSIAK